MRKLLVVLTITIATVSCGDITEAHKSLDDIESFIMVRPDSALSILDSFDLSLLKNTRIWARHSLLHAKAKDKCYIDETDDSLMTQVAAYYQNRHDKKKSFAAYYYLGRIQYNAGEYAKSLLSYTMAEQLVENIDSNFEKALLYAQLGMIYRKHYDYERCLNAYELARKLYEADGKTRYQYYTKLDIGNTYMRLNKYDLAQKEILEVIEWCRTNPDNMLMCSAIEHLLLINAETGENDNIDTIISLSPTDMSDKMIVHLNHALAAAHLKDSSKATAHINQAWARANNIQDSLYIYHFDFKIKKLFGDYANALDIFEEMYHYQDTITRELFYAPLLSAQNNYYKTSSENDRLRIKSQRYLFTIVLVAILAIVLVIFLIIRNNLAIKNIEISRYMEIADELERSFHQKCTEMENLSKNMSVLDEKLKSSAKHMSEIFSRQHELLNRLTRTYYETHGCRKDKEAIYLQVKQEIERLSSDKEAIMQLEELVNRTKNNVMKSIRKFLPNLSEMEYRHLCYWSAGFSAKAISIFTGDSTNNIYVKKSRLKNLINNLPDDIKEQIIAEI